ncbi:MAG: NmrA family NAD(P)-binding protein [Proteobacteria bacterium]|nr:NmrA family NAD(P)-binding protein [Pseudomonadota bacterium]
MPPEILVCGYTGRLGKRVACALRDQHGVTPRVLVRPHHLQKEDWSDPQGMTVYPGAYSASAELTESLSGVDAVFLVSPVHPDMQSRELALAEAAFAANPNVHIVKISGLGTRLDSIVDSGRWHAMIEQTIRSRGIHLSALQPYFFMQNLSFQLESARTTGVVKAGVQDARIAMADERDIADTAARVLLGGTAIEGTSVPLTGSAAYSYADVADLFSSSLKRRVRYVDQNPSDMQAALQKAGQPDWHIQILMQFNLAFQRGWGSTVNSVVEQVLGRAPRSLSTLIEELCSSPVGLQGSDPFPAS